MLISIAGGRQIMQNSETVPNSNKYVVALWCNQA